MPAQKIWIWIKQIMFLPAFTQKYPSHFIIFGNFIECVRFN